MLPYRERYLIGNPCGPGAYRGLLLSLVLVFLAACSDLSGPEYEQPEMAEPGAWSNLPDGVEAGAVIKPEWWKGFGDPKLDALIAQAISQNYDLRVLAARSEVSRAAIRTANAARLPTVEAGLESSYNRSLQQDPTFGNTSTQGDTTRSFGTNLSWEIDIWGKAKKGVEAQEAGFRATEAEWRAGYLTLVSDVAAAYFQTHLRDEQIMFQQTALDRSNTILRIYRAQQREGIVPESRVIQQQAEVEQLEADMLELKRLRQLAENTLNTLLGQSPGTTTIEPRKLTGTVRAIDVPGGLPSDILASRPDIVAAQYRILQAYKSEGQASLARLPTISLTSSINTTNQGLSTLFSDWSTGITPRVSIPIFNPGVNAQYRVSQAQSDLAAEQYRAAVIRAFGEVENSMTNLFSRRQQEAKLKQRAGRLEVVARQVRAQVAEGMATQLEVFEAERSLLEASQRSLSLHQLILTDTLDLYKAMGGGWPKQVVQ